MTIHFDEEKIADSINAAIDLPVITDATEQRLFDLGVRTASDAAAKLIGEILAVYGVTVTDD